MSIFYGHRAIISTFFCCWNIFQVIQHHNKAFNTCDIGGELFTYLRNEGRFDENRARFYAAEIVCAFTYLHSENIVYRDLKPENVLISKLKRLNKYLKNLSDVDGHIKLTDFGFAKRIRDRTWTLCGTPEYLSPEVILNSGHGKAVDWWSLGILIHEMLGLLNSFFYLVIKHLLSWRSSFWRKSCLRNLREYRARRS